jgi:NADPH-dependent F420 reductase
MQSLKIGVIGGTGPQGKGLAYRFARDGHTVIIGSRAADRAQATAAEIQDRHITGTVTAGLNHDAASADLILIAVPYNGHGELITSLRDQLAGKIIISCVNPLGFDKTVPYALHVPEGSAAEQTAHLAPDARLVGAFHHVSAVNLWNDADHLAHEDILVCGDDPEAKTLITHLAAAVTGHHGIDAGPLRAARILEPLTAVLINVNKRYKIRSGIALTGMP